MQAPLLALLGIALLAGCMAPTNSPSGTQNPSGMASPPPATVDAVSTGGAGQHGDQFTPNPLTIPVGGVVTFRIQPGSPHTVEFEQADGVSKQKSGNLDPGTQYQVTFTTAGTHPYFCAYHSSIGGDGKRAGMVGTIEVTA